ncbi:PREDICTED: cAMP-dependent protein kinase type II-beta regulatory subunit [Chinchilla lanigera]|nr:PREDICTED: cAMP-dependent protein kinase type II-beta regulatory subunit [Chinchilla lanigera]
MRRKARCHEDRVVSLCPKENQYHYMAYNKRQHQHLSAQLDSRRKIKGRHWCGRLKFQDKSRGTDPASSVWAALENGVREFGRVALAARHADRWQRVAVEPGSHPRQPLGPRGARRRGLPWFRGHYNYSIKGCKPITFGVIGSLLSEAPAINRFTRRASVCAEAYNPDEEEDDADSRIIHPKTDDQRNRLQEACKDILLFKNLDPEQMSQVLDAMFEKLVKEGEHVIDQGDDGDNFYVIDRGTFDIYVKCDGVGRCVGNYDNRGSFGELALMYNTPRAATITATSPGALWGLDRVTFRRIIVKNNAKKRKMYESFIESLPFLKSLEVSERLKVVDVIGTKVYNDGEQIIAQGDLADSFFIVESGEVKITMKRKGKSEIEENGAVEIARCSRGQYFGELALVTNKPRAASAHAIGTVKCLAMDVQAFERLLGPCMEIMKRNIATYEEQLVALFGTNMDIVEPTA